MMRTILAAAALSLAAAPAFAQGGPGMHGPKIPGGALFRAPMPKLARALDLSQAQQVKIEEVRSDYRERIDADWTAVKRVRESMRALWTSGEVPEKKEIVALQGEMRRHRMQIADAMVDAKLAALKILEPEQRKKLGSMRGMMGKGKGKGKGMGGRGRRGR